jgi:hypothetical protein
MMLGSFSTEPVWSPMRRARAAEGGMADDASWARLSRASRTMSDRPEPVCASAAESGIVEGARMLLDSSAADCCATASFRATAKVARS